jgi:2-dehydro-3-deoxy-D-arabinonate dehydratase
VTSSGKIVGYTIGNDVSSRSIEGENPLYLPQAKTFDGCACLGPCIYVTKEPLTEDTSISMKISRGSEVVFEGETTLREMKRKPQELVDYLLRETSFPQGVFLMTGTGIVPSTDFTLRVGDIVDISIDSIGTLTNAVGA